MKKRLGPTSQPQIAARFDDEDLAILDAVAAAERLSRSDILRRAVRAYAKELGVNPQPNQAA